MAFTNSDLVLLASGPNGNLIYYHDAGSDTMATVAAAGYYNNSDDDVLLSADDLILAQCNDGEMWLRVQSVSSGSVTTGPMSLEGPWRGVLVATATASDNSKITVPGVTEIGSGTASKYTLSAAPYIGAKVTVVFGGTSTKARTITTNSTGVTLNTAGHRTLTKAAGAGTPSKGVSLLGVSTTRWVILSSEGFTTS